MLTQTDKWLIFVNCITIAKSSHIGFYIFLLTKYFFKNYNTNSSENLIQYSYSVKEVQKIC